MPKAIQGENVLPPAAELSGAALTDLRGKVCLVTGGGSGIGAMICGMYGTPRTCHISDMDIMYYERIRRAHRSLIVIAVSGCCPLVRRSSTGKIQLSASPTPFRDRAGV